MKALLPLVLLGLGNIALAQTTDGITDRWSTLDDLQTMVAWEKLMKLTSGESDAHAQSSLRSQGLSDDGATALVAFHRRALAELDRVGKQFHVDVCNKQKQVRAGGVEMAARMVEQTIQQENDARRRLLAEADSLLSRPDQERLDSLYTGENSPRVKIIDTNVAEEVRSGTISVEQMIEVACDISRETGD